MATEPCDDDVILIEDDDDDDQIQSQNQNQNQIDQNVSQPNVITPINTKISNESSLQSKANYQQSFSEQLKRDAVLKRRMWLLQKQKNKLLQQQQRKLQQQQQQQQQQRNIIVKSASVQGHSLLSLSSSSSSSSSSSASSKFVSTTATTTTTANSSEQYDRVIKHHVKYLQQFIRLVLHTRKTLLNELDNGSPLAIPFKDQIESYEKHLIEIYKKCPKAFSNIANDLLVLDPGYGRVNQRTVSTVSSTTKGKQTLLSMKSYDAVKPQPNRITIVDVNNGKNVNSKISTESSGVKKISLNHEQLMQMIKERRIIELKKQQQSKQIQQQTPPSPPQQQHQQQLQKSSEGLDHQLDTMTLLPDTSVDSDSEIDISQNDLLSVEIEEEDDDDELQKMEEDVMKQSSLALKEDNPAVAAIVAATISAATAGPLAPPISVNKKRINTNMESMKSSQLTNTTTTSVNGGNITTPSQITDMDQQSSDDIDMDDHSSQSSSQEVKIYHCPAPNCTASFTVWQQMGPHVRDRHRDVTKWACTNVGCRSVFQKYTDMTRHRAKCYYPPKQYD